ncbi:MAG: hypothetical protein JWL83_4298 [Actinomycetia bacterium]|nr:hypothetical protein [Actinomycetes bacterium]
MPDTVTPTPTFSAPLLGQTEKTLNVILDRLLAGTGLTEPLWVTLAVASGEAADRNELVARVVGALKVSEAEAQARISALAAAQVLQVPETDRSLVTLTDVGTQLQRNIRAAVTQITQRLWGDLPADDLATAGRVLSIILERANAELAGV